MTRRLHRANMSETPTKRLIPNLDELLKHLGDEGISKPLVSAFAASSIEEARTKLNQEIESRLERCREIFRAED